MTEEWRAVPGQPGYEVSSLGRVRSWRGYKPGLVRATPKYLKPFVRSPKGGYLSVALVVDGRRSQFFLQSLVLEVFTGSRPAGMVACHENGDRSDNRLSNLRWDTFRNNSADMVRHGTKLYGERHPRAILTEAQAVEIRRRMAADEDRTALAREFGVSVSTVEKIHQRVNWRHVA